MPRWLIFVGSVFGLFGVLVCILLIYGFLNASSDLCRAYPIMHLDSKNGQHRAEIQNDNCGPDGSMRTLVKLSEIQGSEDASPTSSWSIFIASSAIEVEKNKYAPIQLELHWPNDNEIEISFPQGTKLLSDAKVVNGVTVLYRERSSS